MWCVGQITAEYRQRMYALLELYAQPHDPRAPVICVDEKSKQLLAPTRPALPAKPGAVAKEDYENMLGPAPATFLSPWSPRAGGGTRR